MSCNGSLCADYTVTLGIPRERITLGHMVADNEVLAQKSSAVSAMDQQRIRETVDAQGICLLYVGRMLKLKGLHELLRAWRSVEAKQPDAFLVLVGDGPESEALQGYVAKHGLKRVRFTGRIAHDEIATWYASADCFVIPTLEDNWSLVVPEAMACGLPIVCSKYNGCWPELVQESNGWVFDPLDHDEFVQTLNASIDDHKNYPSRSESSRKIVARFSPKTGAQAIIDAAQIAKDRLELH